MNSENEHIESEFNARSHYIEVRKAAAESFFSSGNYALSANSVEDIRSQFKNLAMLIEHYGTKAVIESALSDRIKITPEQIAESVQKIIDDLRALPPLGTDFIDFAVNWADLKVKAVYSQQMVWPDIEKTEYRVEISEAAPDAVEFHEAVMERFYRKHKIYITVQTEW